MRAKAFRNLSEAELEMVAGGVATPGYGGGAGGGRTHKDPVPAPESDGGGSDLTEPMFQQPEF